MRIQILRSFDFNQMLVTSVFVHFLLMTMVLFLPQAKIEGELIIPAFMVELVEISSGQQAPPKQQPREPAPEKPEQVAQKPEVEKAPPPVPVTPPEPELEFTPLVIPKPELKIKPVDPGKSNEMLQELNELETVKKPELIEELDQLAKLAPKPVPEKPSPQKSQPILEQTFKEQDAIKKKKTRPQKNDLVPPAIEDPLKQFEQLKMQEELESKPVIKDFPQVPKQDNSLKELELAALTRKTSKLEKKSNKKTAADLLKELSKMTELNSMVTPKNQQLSPEELVPSKSSQANKTFAPVLEKLASLDVAPMEISIDVDSKRAVTKDFESGVWKVKVPEVPNHNAQDTPSYVFSNTEGPPGADILSLYIGAIREKVYNKWYEPLAEKHNKEVLVNFFLFPKGNIDKPVLKKSSGVEQLDTLAIRAILDSEPFPEFPKELKFSNLNITINFKYVPEKN